MTASTERDLRAEALDVAASLRTRSSTSGGETSLAPDVVEALRSTGLFRLCLPSELGGPGTPLPAVLGAVEAISQADGSAGWCVAVANSSVSLLAALDRREAAAIAADPEQLCVAGGFAATGRAVRSGDALVISGRWSFASGCSAATWFLGGVRPVDEDGQPQGESVVAFFPADQAAIVPNWDVAGLRATGSHDIVAEATRVPVGRTCGLLAPRWSSDPIARVPFLALGAMLTAATVLGMAERAIEEIIDLAQTKVHFGRRTVLADEEPFQQELAAVVGPLRASRAYLSGHAEAVQAKAAAGNVPTIDQAEAFLAAGAVRDAALRAATFAHDAGGTTSIRQESALNRCLQDILVATRHVALTSTPAGAVGRVLLGQGPQPPILI